MTLQLDQDLQAMHHHARYAYDVGRRAALEIDRLDILVDDGHLIGCGRERRQQRQGGDRRHCLSSQEGRACSRP